MLSFIDHSANGNGNSSPALNGNKKHDTSDILSTSSIMNHDNTMNMGNHFHQTQAFGKDDAHSHAVVMSGINAVSMISYSLSNEVYIQPSLDNSVLGNAATNGSFLGSDCAQWAHHKRHNAYGEVPVVTSNDSAEASNAILDSCINQKNNKGTVSVITGSSSLKTMIPQMFDIAAMKYPCVIHVAAAATSSGNQENSQQELLTDVSDIATVRDTGFGIIASGSVKEAHDLALVSYIAAHQSKTPFLHFFDGVRVAHELSVVEHPVSIPSIQHHIIPHLKKQSSSLLLESASTLGELNEHQHHHHQSADDEIVASVVSAMNHVSHSQFGGRKYEIFEYHGAEDADIVVVAMGQCAQVVHEAVRHLRATTKTKVGVLKVRLLRPWSSSHLLAALPKTTRRICVLDQQLHNASSGQGPLFLDVAASFHSEAQWVTPLLVSGFVVSGTSNSGFTTPMAVAVFRNLASENPKSRFVVGGLASLCSSVSAPALSQNDFDDLSTKTASALVKQVVSWSLRRSSPLDTPALRIAATILGTQLGFFVQQFDTYDSQTGNGDNNGDSSSTGYVSRTDLRFGPIEITSEYAVSHADCIACDNASLLMLPQYGLTKAFAEKGTTLVLNCPWTAEELERELSPELRHELAEHQVKLYVIDATSIVQDASLSRSDCGVDWIMQACLLLLCDAVSYRQAYAHIKRALKRSISSAVRAESLAKILSESSLSENLKLIKYPADEWTKAWMPLSPLVTAVNGNGTAHHKLGHHHHSTVGSVSMFPCGLMSSSSTSIKSGPGVQHIAGGGIESNGHALVHSKSKGTGTPLMPSSAASASSSGANAGSNSIESLASQSYEKLLKQAFGDRLAIANTNGSNAPARIISNEGSVLKSTKKVLPPLPPSIEACYGAFLAQLQARRRLVEHIKVNILDNPRVKKSTALQIAFANWLDAHQDASRARKTANHLIALLEDPINGAAENESLHHVLEHKNLLFKPSKWIVGGDRWSLDVSGSGVHHIISSGEDIKLLVIDSDPYISEDALNGSSNGSNAESKDKDASLLVGDTSSILFEEDGEPPARKPKAPGIPAIKGRNSQKKDIGLYAMMYGGVYVASISIAASHSQALRALNEADAYPGPAVIVAHAPSAESMFHSDEFGGSLQNLLENHVGLIDPLDIDAEKGQTTGISPAIASLAVRLGNWPLYRWNPSALEHEADPFSLDSAKLRADLEEFLSREQQLSLIAKAEPTFAPNLERSLEHELNHRVKSAKNKLDHQQLHDQFSSLANGLNGADAAGAGRKNPILNLLILYGSDGGNASSVAETLAKKAELAECGEVRCMEANEFKLDALAEEKFVVFVLATAGQGEDCANAKKLTQDILTSKSKLSNLKYAVFGLGDSSYWGKGTADSAKYFCKPARDLDTKLAELGATPLVPGGAGLGDDQHDDGYEGALSEWEPKLWHALDIVLPESARGNVGAPHMVDDDIKISSNYLRGTIAQALEDQTTSKIIYEDGKITKFHGIYLQDDRDLREGLDAKGLERAYSFLIRIGIPGGVASSEQYLIMDSICSDLANGRLKITTRQAFQLHGVIKKNLKKTMQRIIQGNMDTLAACGDVNRNGIANPYIHDSPAHVEANKLAHALNIHLKPKTGAYHEIWLDKKKVAGTIDHEPLYGPTYLPRKFKLAIAIPPLNDVDVFAHCLGYIAIVEKGNLVGWNVTIGGGLGTSHGDQKTYPRLADILCFCTPEQAVTVGEKVLLLQRDHGERLNRRHARLKYTVEDHGIEWFRERVEAMCGFKLGKPRPFHFDSNSDLYGWRKGAMDGLWEYVMYVENGVIADKPGYELKKALREIAEANIEGQMTLTANQNIIIGAIPEKRKPIIQQLLTKYNIDNTRYSAMRLHSMACVALPTCALAMAEAQRYLPSLITKLEETLDEVGLRHDAITIRMTGCPNGCARPYMAEIAFIGKAPGIYNLHLGGGFAGNRLNKIYKEGVNEAEILDILRPMLRRYAKERHDGERFGDFLIRTGVILPVLNGRSFWATSKEENDITTPNNLAGKTEGALQVYW